MCVLASSHFDNVCDFVYEVYQMSINNWSGNRLFAEFALADLATLLGATILVFKPDATNVYEPASMVRSAAHDYIFLQMDSHSGCFKWLLPRCHEVVLAATIRSSPSCLFNVASASRHYAAHFFVIGATCLLKYAFEYTSDNMRYRTAFGENASLRMFFAFLSEAPTHTIIAGNTNDERVAFGRVMDDRRQMAAYLNRLCGRARFCGDQMLALIERERIQSNYEGQVMAATLLAKELRDAKDKQQQQQQQQQQQKQRKRRRLTDLLVCSSSKQHDESSASNVDSGSSATTAAACAAQLMLLPPLKRHNSLLVGCDAQEAQVATKIDTVTRLTRPPRLVHSSNLVNTQQQTSAAAAVEPTRPRNKTITQLHTRRSVDICLKNWTAYIPIFFLIFFHSIVHIACKDHSFSSSSSSFFHTCFVRSMLNVLDIASSCVIFEIFWLSSFVSEIFAAGNKKTSQFQTYKMKIKRDEMNGVEWVRTKRPIYLFHRRDLRSGGWD